jgi:Lsr2
MGRPDQPVVTAHLVREGIATTPSIRSSVRVQSLRSEVRRSVGRLLRPQFAAGGRCVHNRRRHIRTRFGMEVSMAQQVNVKYVDDLDGSDAAGTVTFGLDGRAYEIDLSGDNAAKLRDSLADYIAAARKSDGSPTPGGRRAQKMTTNSGPRPQPLDREQTAAIRAWARQNGHQVSERGRIPKTVVEAFQAAH